MKKIFRIQALLCLLFAFPLSTFAQEPSGQPDTLVWKKKLNFSLNLNQASFSSNWKAGGHQCFRI